MKKPQEHVLEAFSSLLSLLFFVYSIVGFSLIPPMSGLITLVFLKILLCFFVTSVA